MGFADEIYMDLALDEAWRYQGLTLPNPAVGCLITNANGKILSIGAHKKAGFLHAELNAILSALCALSENFKAKFQLAYSSKFGANPKNFNFDDFLFEPNFTYDFIMQNHAGLLRGACAYVTLEPCSHHGKTPPCALALRKLGFARMCIGARDETTNAGGGSEILARGGVEVKFGVCAERAKELIEPFYRSLDDGFSFIKINASANGAVGGQIGSAREQCFVHNLRTACDFIGIGGNTVRTDRSRLDTRFAQSKNPKNPNVWIFTHKNLSDFDSEIPLFGVDGREVMAGETPPRAQTMMIEAGAHSFDSFAPFATHALVFYSAKFRREPNFTASAHLQPLFISRAGDPLLEKDEFFAWFKILK